VYSRILIPIDGSEPARAGARSGLVLARALGCEVALCHVYAARLHDERFRQMEPGLPAEFQSADQLGELRQAHGSLIGDGLRSLSAGYLDSILAEAERLGVAASEISMEGRNYVRILEAAGEMGADLIVAGRCGLGTLDGDAHGSTAARQHGGAVERSVAPARGRGEDELGRGHRHAVARAHVRRGRVPGGRADRRPGRARRAGGPAGRAGRAERLALLPIPRWLVLADTALAGGLIDLAQLLPLFVLPGVVCGRAGRAAAAVGVLCAAVVVLNVLGIAAALPTRSNAEAHLAGALGVALIVAASGLVPVSQRLAGLVADVRPSHGTPTRSPAASPLTPAPASSTMPTIW
jgi:nucleotide-binding universal stress UspA family protein